MEWAIAEQSRPAYARDAKMTPSEATIPSVACPRISSADSEAWLALSAVGLRLAVGVPVLLLALAALPSTLAGQRVGGVDRALYAQVMPEAERFDRVGGSPPVVPAYRTRSDGQEVLHGYVFLTSDLPPEQFGYSGPIEALVGMRLDGTLSGVRVVDYQESYMRSMGDFLRRPGFQEQFAGKHIGDPFQLWGDIDGISRVSISVRALSRGVRDSARRVANAYGLAPDVEAMGGEDVDPVGLSWFELRQLGTVERFEVTEPGEGSAGIALALIENERLGEYLLGEALYQRGLQSAERRGGAEHLVLYAIDGSRLRLFRQQGWSIAQEGDTTAIETRQVLSLGLPSGGVVAGEATLVGLMLVGGGVDISQPFTFVYDLDELGVHTVEYVSRQARLAAAEAEAAAAADVAEAATADASAALEDAAEAESEVSTEGEAAGPDTATMGDAAAAAGTLPEAEAETVGSQPAATARPDEAGGERGTGAGNEAQSAGQPRADSQDLFDVTSDETLLERTLNDTSWGRVATLVLVLSLALAAFFTKIEAVRWLSLGVTLVVLGFLDGGFLSVTHITAGVTAGLGVYARDLPLLIFVVFTVVTTLIWGRVFCGFLCPFGALQDFIDRIVPTGWQRPLPQAVHDRAIWVKYGVLAAVLVPALLGSRMTIYPYVEPFGTVFFLSPSVLLWAIAIAFLAASAVVPRFYCRYACPLGAGLALVSFLSLRRIGRVPQCDVCKVCEQTCPTGAIRGPEIDFPECVRCNGCEVKLLEKAGVCRHEMDDVRARLVNIELGPRPVETRDV